MRPPRDSITSVSALAGTRVTVICAALLLLAIIAAYSNTLHAPFVFDDEASIVTNASLRNLSDLRHVLTPPHAAGATVGGRPFLNFTFALNHAISGDEVWSYHVTNVLIHAGCALLLFGLVRRTIAGTTAPHPVGEVPAVPRIKGNATYFAFAVAALWALHPLQTEAVTYISQRAESLATFFYLLTLYAFIRSPRPNEIFSRRASVLQTPSEPIGQVEDRRLQDRRPTVWAIVSVLSCLLGVATKEIVGTAPLVVLLYDSLFVSGSPRPALRSQRLYYGALAATWILLVILITSTQNRGGTAGLSAGMSSWNYALTQARAIPHYMLLALWPSPLVFDYGTPVATGGATVWLRGGVLLVTFGGALTGVFRGRAIGFLGVAFFIFLAPSSSIVPIATQTIAEHRMYLPMAALVVLVGLAAQRWLGRASIGVVTGLALIAGVATWWRNEVYRSEIALWSDTVANAPTNARAHSNLGNALLAAGRGMEAIDQYRAALALQPDYIDAHNNLGRALVQAGKPEEAISQLEVAVRAKPDSVEALTNLGSALVQNGHTTEALPIYERALLLDPTSTSARYNLANAQFKLGELSAAAASYETVLRIAPNHADARFNLATTLARMGKVSEAAAQYERLLQLTPNDATVHAELANILAHLGRPADAIAEYQIALRLQPDLAVARAQLDRLRLESNRPSP